MNKSELSKKAWLLHLNSLAIANGMRSGTFRSLYRGQGIEFSGVREYLRGDDVRTIDWNVTARMGRAFVKQFEEERELDVFIILDKSASMNSGSGLRSRIDFATDCASLITFASLNNASPVGTVIFDGRIQFSCSPKRGKDHSLFLVSQYEKDSENEQGGTCLESALRVAESLLKKHTLIFIISDFRSDGWVTPFARLCQKNDVIALRVGDNIDDKLPLIGAVNFRDIESGIQCVLPTSSSKFSRIWRDENNSRIDRWKKDCIRHSGIPLLLNTNQDPAAELIRFFNSREVHS